MSTHETTKKSLWSRLRDNLSIKKVALVIGLFLIYSYAWPKVVKYYEPETGSGIRSTDKQADELLRQHTEQVVDRDYAKIKTQIPKENVTTADFHAAFDASMEVATEVRQVLIRNQLLKMRPRGEDYVGGDPQNVVDVGKLELRQPFHQVGWAAGVTEFRIRDDDYKLVLPRMKNVCPPSGCIQHVPQEVDRLPRLFKNKPYGAVIVQIGNGRDGDSHSYSEWRRVEEQSVDGVVTVWWILTTPETTKKPAYVTLNMPTTDAMHLPTGRYWDLLDDTIYRERRKFTVWLSSSQPVVASH